MKILVAGATGRHWYSCCEYCYCNGPSARGSGQNRRKIKLLPRGTDIFSMAMFQYLETLYRFIRKILMPSFYTRPDGQDVLAPEQ